MNKETRALLIGDNKELITRAIKDEAGKMFIEGYAVVFGQRSKLIYEQKKFFYETIERGALDGILENDGLNVVLTREHVRAQILARTKSETLALSIDEVGLKYRAELPNTELGRETYELVQRGDLFESSFIFTVTREGQSWARNEAGELERSIKKINSIHDVSVVIDGAYENTNIDVSEAKRFITDEANTQEAKDQAEKINRATKELELIKIK